MLGRQNRVSMEKEDREGAEEKLTEKKEQNQSKFFGKEYRISN